MESIQSKEERISKRKQCLEKELYRIVSILIEKYDPLKIILFGSLATGKTDEYSDIDLVVIKNTTKNFYDRLEETVDLLQENVDTDIIIYTPEEAKELEESDMFFREEVIKKGRVLYEYICSV
ncbi:nucleotidyltransferase domain-containing protein [Thermoanaerobacterium sp. DL9XJH110]|uniref:nucleotidyltransferase domain-containing protein n=1 Tax=Thermoanaerobacterium sp. DL9XJH110 TaxID=3386643 RepID=UPI003BB739A1